jgi:hypothetical protein
MIGYRGTPASPEQPRLKPLYIRSNDHGEAPRPQKLVYPGEENARIRYMLNNVREVDNVETVHFMVGVLDGTGEHGESSLLLSETRSGLTNLNSRHVPSDTAKVLEQPAGCATDIEEASGPPDRLRQRFEIDIRQALEHEPEELLLVLSLICEVLLGVSPLQIIEYRLRVLV